MAENCEIAVLGASGFLGTGIFLRMRSAGLKVRGTCYSHRNLQEFDVLDIIDRMALADYIAQYRPKTVLLLAGSKDVRRCEDDPGFARAVNTEPVRVIAETALKLKAECRIVYFSTDYVFDGLRGNYTDTDSPCPATMYGRSNFEAEQLLTASGIPYTIVRTSAVMGNGTRFWEWLKHSLLGGCETELYDNVRFTPTPVDLVTALTVEICTDPSVPRIIHLVGDRSFSRYEFALEVAETLGGGVSALLRRGESPALFQNNLTMVPSVFTVAGRNCTITEFIRREVKKWR